MRDEELRSSLADVLTEAARRGKPDVGVLRHRIRRRAVRRWVSGALVVLVIAGIGLGVNASLPGSARVVPGVRADSGSRSPHAVTGRLGTWSPAGQLTAADAGPSAAPWVVFMGGSPEGFAYVDNTANGTQVAELTPPAGLTYIGAAAAGDDHTFVVAASGGPDVGFYEVHLGSTGQPGPAVLILKVPAASTPQFLDFALSPDARMLAYTTRTGITVVSLTTRKVMSWPATGGTAEELSWAADDHTLALSWFPAASSGQAQRGVRLLDTRSGGSVLQASRLVIPSGVLTLDGGYPLITSDGTEILATYYVSQVAGPTSYVGEFSARTGHLLTTVTAPRPDAYTIGGSCQVLWADPSGKEVVSTCTSQGDLLYNGTVAESSVSVPFDPGAKQAPDGSISGDLPEGPQIAW